MNSVLASASPPPHQLFNAKFAMPFSSPANPAPSSRKRKADDTFPPDVRMSSASPTSSPQQTSQTLPSTRSIKRPRNTAIGRPLTLPRLLETLDTEALRSVLKQICDSNPAIASAVEKSAPRPSVDSALSVLKNYETKLQEAFPFGGSSTSDYAFNRVRQQLMNLLEALNDFTPHFLPPNETQAGQSLTFMDGATDFVHRLPNWDTFQNALYKQNAYEEISRAWVLVLKEAAKKAAGIHLQYEGWDKKILKHNEQAGGKLQSVVEELQRILGWQANAGGGGMAAGAGLGGEDIGNIRSELLNGTYGAGFPVRVGPWWEHGDDLDRANKIASKENSFEAQ